SIQFKIQGGMNSQVAGAKNFLTYEGGRPGMWGDFNGAGIQEDLLGQSWPNPVGTKPSDIPGADYKWSMSGGGKWDLEDGVKVGAFASVFYERDSSYFDNGKEDSWFITPSEGLVPEYSQGTPSQFRFQSSLLDIEQGSQTVQWGSLFAGGIETEHHRFGATYLFTDTATSTSTLATNTRGKEYFCGPAFDWSFSGFIFEPLPPYDPNDPTSIANTDLYECSPYQRLETLDYTETTTESLILKGEHKLFTDGAMDAFDSAVVDWTLSSSTATFDQPDKTQFSAIWLPASIYYGDPIWLSYSPAENINLGWVQHIKQTIDETSEQIAVNLKLPFTNDNERTGYVKTGVFGDYVERSYRQETYSNRGFGSYAGGWDDPWSAVFPEEDSPIYESEFDIDYDGKQRIGAFYLMADVPIADTWSLIGGARFEGSTLKTTVEGDEFATWYDLDTGQVINFTQNPDAANVDRSDERALPMIGTEWVIEEGLVLRTSYTQTIARQTFREITPILQQEYLGGPIFIGNPDLTLSSLDNYDLRLDFTPAEGWFVSGSWFYKQVADAIEYAQFDSPGGFTFTSPVNYPEGELMGIEAEIRLRFGDIEETLDGLALGFNATFIDSEVTLPEAERLEFEQAGFPITSRDMTAAPAYLLNANATYEFKETGTSVSLFYTVTGDTLVAGAGLDDGVNFVPDIYALPYGSLNFTLQQELDGLLDGLKLFFQAKNLLNPEIETVYRSEYLPDGDVLNTSYTAGIDFAVGLSWQIDF
ncbi:MAG: TonB-dependent receptor domain-containing protein, partial [Planctomycetota bacterium]